MRVAIAFSEEPAALALRVLTNGALVTEGLAAELAALRPMAVELSMHGGCAATHDRATVGHALVVEAPDRVAAILRSFLARVGPEGVES